MKGIIIIVIICFVPWEVRAAVNCRKSGRFADIDDATCKNYSLCVTVAANTYQIYKFTCPSSSVFDPTLSRCSDSYECKNFICTQEGLFPDPSYTNCTGFVECIQTNTTYITTRYVCPANTFFNPDTMICAFDYNCTIASNSMQSNAAVGFTCSEGGRFPDATDSVCKRYHFCVQSNEGTFSKYDYECPGASVFSPLYKFCTAKYTCPRR